MNEQRPCMDVWMFFVYLGVCFAVFFLRACNWANAAQSYVGLRSLFRRPHRGYATSREIHDLFDRPTPTAVFFLLGFLLQMSHPTYGPMFQAHTMMDTRGSKSKQKNTRRLVRTFAGLTIWFMASADDRRLVKNWMGNVHGHIPLYDQEGQLFVLATLAWVAVKYYQLVGSVTPVELDGTILAFMEMMNYLHEDKKIASRMETIASVADLERYMRSHKFDAKVVYKNLSHLEGSMSFLLKNKTQQSIMRIILADKSIFDNACVCMPHSLVTRSLDAFRLFMLQIAQPFHSFFQETFWPKSNTLTGFVEALLSPQSVLPQERRYFLEVMDEIFGNNAKRTTRAANSSSGWTLATLSLALQDSVTSFLEPHKCSYFLRKLKDCKEKGELIKHIGVIMDGNRRKAKASKLERVGLGHELGSKKLQDCVVWSLACGLENITVWAFSKDNFNRPKEELQDLYAVLREGFVRLANMKLLSTYGVRVHVIGDLNGFPNDVREAIDLCLLSTKMHSVVNFTIALGYGGHDEIANAAQCCNTAGETLTVENLRKYTYHRQLGLQPVDGILRTSGEHRLSGFMLWDSQYAEYSVVNETWPDLRESVYYEQIWKLSRRQRRLGK